MEKSLGYVREVPLIPFLKGGELWSPQMSLEKQIYRAKHLVTKCHQMKKVDNDLGTIQWFFGYTCRKISFVIQGCDLIWLISA